ncbi:MAG: hypothetical protein QOI07_37 [Verrucomicrobiota bacterium]|jgi:hypothetical protein
MKMPTLSGSATVWLALVAAAAGHDLPRTPIHGVPRILGREIPRLILIEPIYPTHSAAERYAFKTLLSEIPASQFVPVSEDRDGVFFQGSHGLGQPASITAKTVFWPGGLYVSKKEPDTMYWYLGDATGRRWVDMSPRPLLVEENKRFLIGRPVRNR